MAGHRNTLASAVRLARFRLSRAQRATRGQQRRYHIWSDAAAILSRAGHADLSDMALDRAYQGWNLVDVLTARELSKD